MTPEQLAAIRARAEAATPGPWYAQRWHIWGRYCREEGRYRWKVADLASHSHGDGLGLRPHCPDAEFIAHAREDIPALVAEVERLQAELARLRPVVEAAQRWHVAVQHYDAAMSSRDYGAADLADAELNAATERLIAAVAGLDAAREEPR